MWFVQLAANEIIMENTWKHYLNFICAHKKRHRNIEPPKILTVPMCGRGRAERGRGINIFLLIFNNSKRKVSYMILWLANCAALILDNQIDFASATLIAGPKEIEATSSQRAPIPLPRVCLLYNSFALHRNTCCASILFVYFPLFRLR